MNISDMSQMQTGDVGSASNECIDSDLTPDPYGLSISLSNLHSSGLVGPKLKQTELPTGRE